MVVQGYKYLCRLSLVLCTPVLGGGVDMGGLWTSSSCSPDVLMFWELNVIWNVPLGKERVTAKSLTSTVQLHGVGGYWIIKMSHHLTTMWLEPCIHPHHVLLCLLVLLVDVAPPDRQWGRLYTAFQTTLRSWREPEAACGEQMFWWEKEQGPSELELIVLLMWYGASAIYIAPSQSTTLEWWHLGA